MKRIFSILVCVLLALSFTGCKDVNRKFEATGNYLDTFVSVSIYGGSQEIASEAVELCGYYEKIFSRTRKDALLYKVNETGELKVETDEDRHLYNLICEGYKYCMETEGALDITIEPVSDIWKRATSEEVVPSDSKIEEALAQVDYHKITILEDAVLLGGTRLDLGAVAKGYIADRIKEFLVDKGVEGGIINLGGNILCIGEKSDGSDFRIGIQRPFDVQGEPILKMNIEDKSVVTSGIYERYFESGGKLYHHIIDASTGRPCDNNIYSVTIISDKSIDCDCLSTACFIMGIDRALEYIDKIEGTYAVFIDDNYNLIYSAGAADFVS